MSNGKGEEDEIEAARQRLKGFIKPASQCKNHHDPERLARAKEGRENVPRNVWHELGRRPWTLW